MAVLCILFIESVANLKKSTLKNFDSQEITVNPTRSVVEN